MYGCERWTVKKAECQRIDAFELWCWRRLLRVPWTARRSNQSSLKEISPGCSLEGLMLKLKLQHFGHLMEELIHWKRPWCWEGLGTGGEGDNRGWDGWIASSTQWKWVWENSRGWWWIGRTSLLQFMGSQRVGHDWAIELNWTEEYIGLPWWLSDKESACQCRRHGFDPWIRKIPLRRIWQPTPVFLPGKSKGQSHCSPGRLQSTGCKESDTTETNNSKEHMANHFGKNIS